MTALNPHCHHIPTSPGQSMCQCLDTIMHLRLTVELLCRRIVELEHATQTHQSMYVSPSQGVVSSTP